MPHRTITFIAYAAEEVGLKGSNAIAQDYQDSGINVIGGLQLDMTNYKGSAEDVYIIDDDYTSAAQNQFLRDLIRAYNRYGTHRVTHGNTGCGYGCSGHACDNCPDVANPGQADTDGDGIGEDAAGARCEGVYTITVDVPWHGVEKVFFRRLFTNARMQGARNCEE